MEIKDLIKTKRQELSLTYEELGNLVGVGKSTVRKWETGMIENMKRDNIISLSRALNISPIELMGLNNIDDSSMKNFTDIELSYISDLRKLNDIGIEKALNYTKDLADLPKYQKASWEKEGKEFLMPIAAHDDDLTENEKNNMDSIIEKELKKGI